MPSGIRRPAEHSQAYRLTARTWVHITRLETCGFSHTPRVSGEETRTDWETRAPQDPGHARLATDLEKGKKIDTSPGMQGPGQLTPVGDPFLGEIKENNPHHNQGVSALCHSLQFTNHSLTDCLISFSFHSPQQVGGAREPNL